MQLAPLPQSVFQVTITGESGTKSTHTVSVDQSYYEQLTEGIVMPDELVRQAILFLLDREPKESILDEFQLPVISTNFPEFESAIKTRLHHI